MKFLYGLAGANVPVIKEFTVKSDCKIMAGEVVFLNGDGVVDSEGDILLGVCAEDHTGVKDILNERADKENLRVDITKGGVYEMACPVITAQADGTSATLVCDKELIDETAAGSYLAFVKCGEGSANAEKQGNIRKIISVTSADDVATVTLEDGESTFEGDEYVFIPKTGFEGSVGEDNNSFVATASGSYKLKSVKCDIGTYKLQAVFTDALFN